MRATNLMYRNPKEQTPDPYIPTVKLSLNILQTLNNGISLEYAQRNYNNRSFGSASRFIDHTLN